MKPLGYTCERARQWSSLELDGELSSFERALLDDHLAACGSCREFQSSSRAVASRLRAAPLEPLGRAIEVGSIRRRPRLLVAPTAAAMAVALVGLGSFLASLQMHSGRVDALSAGHARSLNVSAAKLRVLKHDPSSFEALHSNAGTQHRAGRFRLTVPATTMPRRLGGPVVANP